MGNDEGIYVDPLPGNKIPLTDQQTDFINQLIAMTEQGFVIKATPKYDKE
jgi:hypothetical protein